MTTKLGGDGTKYGRSRSFPPDLIARLQAARDQGKTTLQIAREYGVAENTVQRRTKAPCKTK